MLYDRVSLSMLQQVIIMIISSSSSYIHNHDYNHPHIHKHYHDYNHSHTVHKHHILDQSTILFDFLLNDLYNFIRIIKKKKTFIIL